MIDTSGLSANKLRAWIKELVETERAPLTLLFESFAFKFGVPLDADLVFDVRVLPNPYYDLDTAPFHRHATRRSIAFLDAQPASRNCWPTSAGSSKNGCPSFKNDNRSYLTVAHRLHRRPAPLRLHGRTTGQTFPQQANACCCAIAN